jgi:hypothetical protein
MGKVQHEVERPSAAIVGDPYRTAPTVASSSSAHGLCPWCERELWFDPVITTVDCACGATNATAALRTSAPTPAKPWVRVTPPIVTLGWALLGVELAAGFVVLMVILPLLVALSRGQP